MTRPFSLAFRQRMVRRLSGKDAVSARRLSQETGITQQTLSRWLQEARRLPLMPSDRRGQKQWSIDEKIRVMARARELSGDELAAFLESEGLVLAELEQWRLSLDEGSASKATTKRIRKLERELARKEKALAEAAALLVLKKKLQHLWEDEDDGTDEESAK
jgi:transposase